MSAPFDTTVGQYYHQILPGQVGSVGDKKISWDQAEMDTSAYRQFERAHDSYLTIIAMNLVILAAVVAIFTHLTMVVTNQREFTFSTMQDLFEGPLLLVVLAGLIGVGLLFGHMGVPENLYYALYAPFGIIVLGVGLWSLFDSSDVNNFNLPSFGKITDNPPETFIWIGIISLVTITSILQWMQGKMRLDAISAGSSTSLVFIAMASIFSYGLSRLFALVIRTLSHHEIGGKDGQDSMYYFLSYVMASIAVVLFVVASVKFLDLALTFVGGQFNVIFAPPTGVGASKAIIETQRAFQMSIYVVIFLSAALMWRRRDGLVQDEETNEQLTDEWSTMLALLIIIPFLAVVSEGIKDWVELYTPFYDLLRAIFLSVILVYVGTGFIPWNYVTLGISSAIVVFLSLRYVEVQENWDKPLAALICVTFFIFGKMAFRKSELLDRITNIYKNEDENDENDDDKVSKNIEQVNTFSEWMSWIWWVLFPAFLLVVISTIMINAAEMKPGYGGHLFRIYGAFVFVYSLTLTFVDTTKQSPISDSPFYDLIPENEAASLAIDGVILMACLMISTSIWNFIIPKSGNIFSYLIVGIACTYLYINIRHDRDLSSYARKSQQKTEVWYTNVLKDGVWEDNNNIDETDKKE